MPTIKKNRIGVMVYLMPDTYRALEDIRNPHVSTSAHCAMILDEVVGTIR
jgi:hypothetical protein